MEHGSCDYETRKAPDLPSASERTRKAGGVILSEYENQRTRGTMSKGRGGWRSSSGKGSESTAVLLYGGPSVTEWSPPTVVRTINLLTVKRIFVTKTKLSDFQLFNQTCVFQRISTHTFMSGWNVISQFFKGLWENRAHQSAGFHHISFYAPTKKNFESKPIICLLIFMHFIICVYTTSVKHYACCQIHIRHD